MHVKDKALSALLAAFPTAQSWSAFSQNSNNAAIRDSILAFACRYGLIDTPDATELEKMVRGHSAHRRAYDPQASVFRRAAGKEG